MTGKFVPQANPFAVRGHHVPSVAVALGGLNGGHARSFGVSGSDLANYYRIGLPLGGKDQMTRPMAESEMLFACTKAKASAASQAAVRIYESDAQDAKQIPSTDSLAQLLANFNRLTSWCDAMVAHAFARTEHGEDWWFLADLKGNPIAPGDEPVQIIQARPPTVDIVEFDDAGWPTTYAYAAVGKNGASSQRKFPAHAVLGFVDYSPYDLWRGLGPAKVLARSLAVGFQEDRYMEAFAREGGAPGGFMECRPETGLAELERMQATVDDEFGNAANANRIKVLPAGVTFKPNPHAPKDMEFQASQRWRRELVSAVTGVPLPVVGILENATYSNYEQAIRAMWLGPNGVVALLAALLNTLNTRFFPRLRDPRKSKWRIRIDLSSVAELRVDVSQRVQIAAQVARLGVGATLNEALELCGVEHKPLPNGDQQIDPYGGLGGTGGGAVDENGNPIDGSGSGDGASALNLNGAQMSSAVEIARLVAAGELPRDTGVGLLANLLGIPMPQAEEMLASAGSGTPTTPNPIPLDASGNPPADPSSPDPSAPSDSPAPSDAPTDDEEDPAEDPADDESKSAQRAPRMPLETRELREQYATSIEARIYKPADSRYKKAALKFLRDFYLAQLKLFRQFARDGTAGKSFDAATKQLVERAASGSAIYDVLLLNRAKWEERMRQLFEAPVRSVVDSALEDIADELESVSIGVEDPRVLDLMSKQLIKLSEGVNGTLAEQVRKVLITTLGDSPNIGALQQAVKDALPELEGALKQAFASRDARALAIARTETGHSVNGARQLEMRAEGVTQSQWITAGDDAVRQSHLELDGQVRAIDSEFAPNLRHPHDPLAPADQVINCRCTSIPVD